MKKIDSVFITTQDKVQIHLDHYQRGHKQVVIVAPGFYNSKEALLMKELATELGDYDVIVMDFRGHGKSKGLFYWTSKEYKDLLAVIDFAKPQYKDIAVIGFSLGAATALITANKTDLIKSIVAVSAPTDFDKIEFRFWELDPKLDLEYSILGEGRIGKGVRPGPWWDKKEKPIDGVKEIKAPLLYIHGADDWLIKPWHSEALYKKTESKKRLVLIKKGPHAEYLIKTHKEETIQAIREWLKETLEYLKEDQ